MKPLPTNPMDLLAEEITYDPEAPASGSGGRDDQAPQRPEEQEQQTRNWSAFLAAAISGEPRARRSLPVTGDYRNLILASR